MKNPSKILFTLVAAALVLAQGLRAQGFTQVRIKNTVASAKTDVNLTFGMLFKQGDVPTGKTLAAAAGAAAAQVQVDPKATYADGSLRHAVLSVHLDNLAASDIRTLGLSAVNPGTEGAALDAAEVLKTTFDAVVTVNLGGVEYRASARDLLATAGKKWLSGPLCTEWLVSAPLKTAAGAAHPHLQARFAIRAYKGYKNIRADVTVENAWAFEPNPQGYTYDAKITVGGSQTFSKAAIPHTHHARWRKVYWWGGDPGIDYDYSGDYLFSTGGFPYYDRSLKVNASAMTAMEQDFDPMANGNLTSYMPMTGAHDDIGPLPRFSALYLLTMDPRARGNMLANGNCGGSYSIHFRHKATDLPVSLDDFPYMTILGNPSDTYNPVTAKSEAFPSVTNGLDKHSPDDAHQPSIAYVPYVVSGDLFYLEELQFWANWNMVLGNPSYRSQSKGLLWWGQNRAQAWGMRTLGQTAFITPDSHPLKKYFSDRVKTNLEWYSKRYLNDSANKLGYLEGNYAYPPFGIAPWQDDFFTWTIGYLTQLGYAEAKPLMQWKSKFVVGRFVDPGYCWLNAAAYSLQVGNADKVPFKTFGELMTFNYPGATCTGVKMNAYPEMYDGYVANMQPALAAAVDAAVPGAKEAWDKYQTRNPKQAYESAPQFAVVPKGATGTFARLPGPQGRLPQSRGLARAVPGSTFQYELQFPAKVVVDIFDTVGHRLLSLPLGRKEKGRHVLDWNRDLGRSTQNVGNRLFLLRLRGTDDFLHVEDIAVTGGNP